MNKNTGVLGLTGCLASCGWMGEWIVQMGLWSNSESASRRAVTATANPLTGRAHGKGCCGKLHI